MPKDDRVFTIILAWGDKIEGPNAYAVDDLYAALKDLLGDAPLIGKNGICRCCGRDYEGNIPKNDECLDDCPGMKARRAIAKAECRDA